MARADRELASPPAERGFAETLREGIAPPYLGAFGDYRQEI
jgi:hypothetical protein